MKESMKSLTERIDRLTDRVVLLEVASHTDGAIITKFDKELKTSKTRLDSMWRYVSRLYAEGLLRTKPVLEDATVASKIWDMDEKALVDWYKEQFKLFEHGLVSGLEIDRYSKLVELRLKWLKS